MKVRVNQDTPPVDAVETGIRLLPENEFATFSFFKRPKQNDAVMLNAFYFEKTKDTLSIFISSKMKRENHAALVRISNLAWIDFLEICTQPENKIVSIQFFFDLLNGEISKIGGSNFYFDFFSLQISSSRNEATIVTNCPESVIRIRGRHGESLNSNQNGKKAKSLTYRWKLSRTKAIIFADKCQELNLVDVASKLSQLIYPVNGAAELLHFELMAKEASSNVIWVELQQKSSKI